jgi:hypothetical protein
VAYRKLDAQIVENVLLRWQKGESSRSIARATGLDRKTVGRWLSSAKRLALPRERALTDGEVRAVMQRTRRSVGTREPSETWLGLLAQRERLARWLSEPAPLPLSTAHLLLAREHNVQTSYATLRRFALRELGWRRAPDASPRMSPTPPGPASGVRISVVPSADDEDLLVRLAANGHTG